MNFPPTGGLEARTAKTNLRKPITSTFCLIEPFPITINQSNVPALVPSDEGFNDGDPWGSMDTAQLSTGY